MPVMSLTCFVLEPAACKLFSSPLLLLPQKEERLSADGIFSPNTTYKRKELMSLQMLTYLL